MGLLHSLGYKIKHIVLILGFLTLVGNMNKAQAQQAITSGLNRTFITTDVDTSYRKIKSISKYLLKAEGLLEELNKFIEGEKNIFVDKGGIQIKINFTNKEVRNFDLQINIVLEIRKNLDSTFLEISKINDPNLRNAYVDEVVGLIKECDEILLYVIKYDVSKFYYALMDSAGLDVKFDNEGDKKVKISKSENRKQSTLRLIEKEWSNIDKRIRNIILILKKNGLKSAARELTNLWNLLYNDIDSIKEGKAPIYFEFFYKSLVSYY